MTVANLSQALLLCSSVCIVLPVCCIAMPSPLKKLNLEGLGYVGVKAVAVEAAVNNIEIVKNTGG